jgi:hypothetical protein
MILMNSDSRRERIEQLALTRADQVSRLGGALKVAIGAALGLSAGLASAYAWAHGKVDRSEVATVQTSMHALSERMAKLEGKTDAIITQNEQALRLLKTLDGCDVRHTLRFEAEGSR